GAGRLPGAGKAGRRVPPPFAELKQRAGVRSRVSRPPGTCGDGASASAPHDIVSVAGAVTWFGRPDPAAVVRGGPARAMGCLVPPSRWPDGDRGARSFARPIPSGDPAAWFGIATLRALVRDALRKAHDLPGRAAARPGSFCLQWVTLHAVWGSRSLPLYPPK